MATGFFSKPARDWCRARITSIALRMFDCGVAHCPILVMWAVNRPTRNEVDDYNLFCRRVCLLCSSLQSDRM